MLSVSIARLTADIFCYSGTALNILSYQPKKRFWIVFIQSISNSLWTVHFILLAATLGAAGAWSAAIVNAISMIRNLVYTAKGKLRVVSTPLVPGFFITAFLVAGVLTFTPENPLCILSSVAMIIATVTNYLSSERKIRLLSLLISSIWLVYNASLASIPTVVCEAITFLSILFSLIRYEILARRAAKEETGSEE